MSILGKILGGIWDRAKGGPGYKPQKEAAPTPQAAPQNTPQPAPTSTFQPAPRGRVQSCG